MSRLRSQWAIVRRTIALPGARASDPVVSVLRPPPGA